MQALSTFPLPDQLFHAVLLLHTHLPAEPFWGAIVAVLHESKP